MTTLEQELEIALRAETPRPSAAFEQRMDERLAAGFPRKSKLRLPSSPLPAIAAGTAVIVAVVIGVSRSGGSGESTSTGGAPAVAVPKASAESRAAPSSGVTAQTAPATPLPAVRRVERSAALTLAAPGSKLDDVANQIVSVVDRRHGFVLHSTVTTGGGGATGGEFELRVASASLQDTLSDLSGLADVRSRTQNADDITQPYNAVQAK